MTETLDSIDHIALPSADIAATVAWYQAHFRCSVVYQDPTWAMLEFGNIKLAFVTPGQHPSHLALVRENAESFGPLKTHRDGTRSTYAADPGGNTIEIMAP